MIEFAMSMATICCIDNRRRKLYPITDKHGLTMLVDMGGIVPLGNGPIYLLSSHDESCFAAGDFQSKVLCALLCSHASNIVSVSGLGEEGDTTETMQVEEYGSQVSCVVLLV